METEHQAETLAARAEKVMRETQEAALPGFEAYLSRDSKAADWIAEQEAKISTAVRDEDSILLERALGSWSKAIGRVNEILAEEYRQANPDASGDGWELRYVKWMTKVKYIRFESPMGEFYLLPRMPSRRPKAPHWYTVDEMLVMLDPKMAPVITALGVLPIRPESIPRAGPGDKILHFDATGPQVEMTYEFEGGAHHGRKRVR